MNRRHLLALCASLLLTGCPAGGEDPQVAGVGSGGTGSYSGGSITGRGSIVVNGVHFDERSAQVVTDEGVVLTAADLALGMVVEVEAGEIVTRGGRQEATATTVRRNSLLLGPVDEVQDNTAEGRLAIVMGQHVQLTSQTHWDDTLAANTPAGPQAGDVVEVFGYFDASQDLYIATRVEKVGGTRAVAGPYKVRGVVKSLNRAARTCTIGRQQMTYEVSDGLIEGLVAQGRLDKAPDASGIWQAEGMTPVSPLVTDREGATLEGLVTRVLGPAQFMVDGIEVDASGASCTACALFTVGTHLRVKGRMQSGVLVATEVALWTP